MKNENIPGDIKSKSLKEAREEIDRILSKLESLESDLSNSLADYQRLTQLNKHVDSLFAVSRDEHKLGKINNGKFIPFNYKPGQRSQDLEPLYFENGLLYIAKAALIEKGELINENSYPLIVEHPFAKIDIDTQEDFDYAEYLLKVKSEK